MTDLPHFVRWPEVERITGLSRDTIERMEKRGEFPSRYRITANTTAHRSDELAAWIDSRERIEQKAEAA
jgi:prophage regulatory protein